MTTDAQGRDEQRPAIEQLAPEAVRALTQILASQNLELIARVDALEAERDIADTIIKANAESIADLEDARDALAARLAAAEAERDAIQAAWTRDKVLADEAIDHHMRRWKQAEARLAAAEAANTRTMSIAVRPIYVTTTEMPEWQRFECRVCREVGLLAETIKHAADCPIAALAGSREQAATTTTEGE